MRYILSIFIFLVSISAISQREVIMSQYMYNKYTINSAFAGSHDVLSVFGSYRKQWMGFDDSPAEASFTLHSPLKNERVALGAQFYNETYGVVNNTGFSASYAYRIPLKNQSVLAFGVSAGLVSYQSDWSDVELVDEDPSVFGYADQSTAPSIGFGAALYGSKYFAGLSVPSFIYHDTYLTEENSVDFTKIDYLITGGYLFKLNDMLSLQPSALIRMNLDDKTYMDVSATALLFHTLMIGSSYRTTDEIIGMVGYQVNTQLRFTYSLDYNMESLGSYNNGTHEVSIQYDFGYKINSPNPKFF
jgi:type IX secretion system PorP/SprF family membrane protein